MKKLLASLLVLLSVLTPATAQTIPSFKGVALGGPVGPLPTLAGLGYQFVAQRSFTGSAPYGINGSMFHVPLDTAVIGGVNFLNVLAVQNYNFGGPNVTGGRQGIQAIVRQTASTAAVNPNRNNVAGTFQAINVSGDAGKGLTSIAFAADGTVGAGQAAGTAFGINPYAELTGFAFNGDTSTDVSVDSNNNKIIKNVTAGVFPNLVVGQTVRGSNVFSGIVSEGTKIVSFDANARTITLNQPVTNSLSNVPFGASFAQYMANISGAEVNVTAKAGSSLYYKSGIQIVGMPDNAVQGSAVDCMLCLSDQGGGIGWKDGILFGDMNSQYPIVANGYLLRSQGAGRATVGLSALGVFTSSNYAAPTGSNITATRPLFVAQDGTFTNTPTSPPATATSACQPGMMSTDGNYLYVCVGTNTWKRTSTQLATF